MPTIRGGRGAQGGQKENLNTVIAKPAHMGSGLQHQAGARPPRCRGSATPWLACPYGGGGTQCKGLLSQQMASQVGHYHPKFEGGKVVSAVVMPPQAHRELQGKQNKTKQISFQKLFTTDRKSRHVDCKTHAVVTKQHKKSVRSNFPFGFDATKARCSAKLMTKSQTEAKSDNFAVFCYYFWVVLPKKEKENKRL